jgi:hypothetical protein
MMPEDFGINVDPVQAYLDQHVPNLDPSDHTPLRARDRVRGAAVQISRAGAAGARVVAAVAGVQPYPRGWNASPSGCASAAAA